MKDNIKKKLKKVIPFILVGVMASSLIFFGYDKANEVKAVAGVDDIAVAGLITAILMSYGYVTLDYYNNTDGSSALADDWEEAYEQARFQVLNGGGSGDNNDDDNDDDWEDTDGDGKITEKDIPKFNQLYNPTSGASALGATFLITANAGKLLAPIVSKFIKSKYGKQGDTTSLKEECSQLHTSVKQALNDKGININSYKYVARYLTGTNSYYEIYSNVMGICDDTGALIVRNGVRVYRDRFSNRIEIEKDFRGSFSPWSYTVTSSLMCFCNASHYKDQESLNDGNKSNNDWIDPNIGDGFDNKGDLELLPPPHSTDISSYNIPTQQALQDLLNNLNNPNLLPEQQKQTLLDFINNLGNKPDPDIGKDPDKNPNPDPNPKPDPDTGKDPDKNPEPDPDPNPDTGKDADNNTFTADLKELFPFCIPFDIVDCFRLFNAEPETPRVIIPMHFGIVDKDYTFDIDLKDFNDVANVCRTSFLILFIVGLGFATSAVIKW